ncbi:MAG TPA: hypothetical protein VD999_03565 [Vitreimonas sp.]|nr:hypothetical protein [Vitreimonas sp.]
MPSSKYPWLAVGLLLIGIILAGVIIIGLLRWSFRRLSSGTSSPTITTAATPIPEVVVQTQDKLIVIEDPLLNHEGLRVEEFTTDPNQHLGQAVTLKGQVSQRINPWGFALRSAGEPDAEVLIVTNGDITQKSNLEPAGLDVAQAVVVKGIAKLLTKEGQTEQFGFEIDDLSTSVWQDQVVVVADSVTVVEASPQ